MPVKIGKDIVIYDDMVFQVGYGTPEEPENGMIRYNPQANDFEFYIADRWARSGAKSHPLYDMIRYNEELEDYQFLIAGRWVHRCIGMCPTHDRCEPCPTPEPCEDPEICPPCPGFLLDDPDYVRYYTLKKEGIWHRDVNGSEGLYIDYWDLSYVPYGAQIDFRYQAYIIPDRFLVLYPTDTLIFDSGWVSTEPHHDLVIREDYQFTVSHPGNDTIPHLITKMDSSELRVVVFGSENSLTEWNYSLRYIYKNKYKIMVRFHPEEVRFYASWGIDEVGGAYVHEEVAFDIPGGEHRLHFIHVEGWDEPYSLDVYLSDGLPDYLLIVDVYYTVEETKLRVLIEPPEARFYARWKIEEQYNTYGHDTTIELEQGEYVLAPQPAYGWTAPANIDLNITSTGLLTVILTYERNLTDLTVIIEPPEMKSIATWDIAIQSGVLSNVELDAIEDDAPFSDGHTISVPYGLHDIIPSNHFGWITPVIPSVHIEDMGSVTIIVTYELLCSEIRVTMHPSEVHGLATWTIAKHATAIPSDGILPSPFGYCNTETEESGPYAHNKIISVPYGMYDITPSDVPGWITPTIPSTHVGMGTTITVPVIYDKEMSTLQITIQPYGLNAEWMVDGQTGILTGTRLIPIQTGTHTVIPYEKTGYITPPIEDVEVPTTDTVTHVLVYEQISVMLTVLVEPEEVRHLANWTVDTVGGVYSHGDSVEITYGDHYVTPASVDGWTNDGSVHVIVETIEDETITIYYTAITAMVNVSIYPHEIRAAAKWYVNHDPGVLLQSGNEKSVPFGPYEVRGTDVAMYTTPAAISDSITTSATKYHELHYEIMEAVVTVMISPESARDAGALWKLGTAFGFRAHGDSIVIAAGTYTLTAKTIPGHDAPPDTDVTIPGDSPETFYLDYVITTGTIEITIIPDDIGAQWKIDGAGAYASGHVETVEAGTYTISGTDVVDYDTPSSFTITVTAGDAATGTLIYSMSMSTIIVNIVPSGIGATWSLDGSGAYASGFMKEVDAGTYTVEGSDVTGYVTPSSQTVTVTPGAVETRTLTYESSIGSIQVMIVPSTIGAHWQIDGVGAYESGHIEDVEAGTYTISGTEVDGYDTPSSISVTVAPGVTGTVTLMYLGFGCDMDPFNGHDDARANPLVIGNDITYIKIKFQPYDIPDRICIYEGEYDSTEITNQEIIDGDDIAVHGMTLLYDSGWWGELDEYGADTISGGALKYPGLRNAYEIDLYINTDEWTPDIKTIVVFGFPGGSTAWRILEIECFTDPVPVIYQCNEPTHARPISHNSHGCPPV